MKGEVLGICEGCLEIATFISTIYKDAKGEWGHLYSRATAEHEVRPVEAWPEWYLELIGMRRIAPNWWTWDGKKAFLVDTKPADG
jgi:hypothetical protein